MDHPKLFCRWLHSGISVIALSKRSKLKGTIFCTFVNKFETPIRYTKAFLTESGYKYR